MEVNSLRESRPLALVHSQALRLSPRPQCFHRGKSPLCRPSRRASLSVPPCVTTARVSPPASSLPDWAHDAERLHAGAVAPHAGSHFAVRARRGGASGRFFEGWYLRVVLPGGDGAFAFMFSVEEFCDSEGEAGRRREVVGQMLDPQDRLYVRRFGGGDSGWVASERTLALANWEEVAKGAGGRGCGKVAPRVLSRSEFARVVASGFQLTSSCCAGKMEGQLFQAKGGHGGDVLDIAWEFDMAPLLAWGTRGGRPRATATWLSHLPVFEPGYQVLMAHGLVSTGYIRCGGRRWDMRHARVYCEKNWGASFPKKWWWLQANLFHSVPDLSVTAVGARRKIGDVYEETIGMIAVHLNGKMYEFSNWNCRRLSWRVGAWGRWEVQSTSRSGHQAVVHASTTDKGTAVLGPSIAGMVPSIRDAAYGRLTLTLVGPGGEMLLDRVQCFVAQVETGGGPWDGVGGAEWVVDVRPLRQPLRGIINFAQEPVQTST